MNSINKEENNINNMAFLIQTGAGYLGLNKKPHDTYPTIDTSKPDLSLKRFFERCEDVGE